MANDSASLPLATISPTQRISSRNYVRSILAVDDPGRAPLSELLKEWIGERKSRRRRATIGYNQRVIDLYIVPKIGAVPMRNVTTKLLGRLLAELETDDICARTRREVFIVFARGPQACALPLRDWAQSVRGL
jgi:hypothetical protein